MAFFPVSATVVLKPSFSRYIATISDIFFSSSTTNIFSVFPSPIEFISDKESYNCEGHAPEDIYRVMIPAINGRKNEQCDNRKGRIEEAFVEPVGESRHH